MFKNLLSDYLSFTRKERTGIIVILMLILIFSLLPFLFPYFIKEKKTNADAFKKEIATLRYKQADSAGRYVQKDDERDYRQAAFNRKGKKYDDKPQAGTLFYFDPNTLSTEGWRRLGIKDRTIITIQRYLSKGGKFKKPEEIGRVWGLHENEVQRLIPYITIAPPANVVYPERKNTVTRFPDKQTSVITRVDINTADTSVFIALPGIGSRLANRIINFRDKLGGFYKTEQVAETFALPDSTFQKIRSRLFIGNPAVKQININTASVDELKIHPYIRYNLSIALVQYRAQHGNFSSPAGIKKIMMVTDEMYDKLLPYITVQ